MVIRLNRRRLATAILAIALMFRLATAVAAHGLGRFAAGRARVTAQARAPGGGTGAGGGNGGDGGARGAGGSAGGAVRGGAALAASAGGVGGAASATIRAAAAPVSVATDRAVAGAGSAAAADPAAAGAGGVVAADRAVAGVHGAAAAVPAPAGVHGAAAAVPAAGGAHGTAAADPGAAGPPAGGAGPGGALAGSPQAPRLPATDAQVEAMLGRALPDLPATAAGPTRAQQPPPPGLARNIRAAAGRTGLPADLIAAVIMAESAGDPTAVSPAGAKGLMQLEPPTASWLGVHNAFDPTQNVNAGADYLAALLQQYLARNAVCAAGTAVDVPSDSGTGPCPSPLIEALAAYNAGPRAVATYGGVPPYPETQRYIAQVLANFAAYSADGVP